MLGAAPEAREERPRRLGAWDEAALWPALRCAPTVAESRPCLLQALARAVERGASGLFLHVEKSNEAALGLCEEASSNPARPACSPAWPGCTPVTPACRHVCPACNPVSPACDPMRSRYENEGFVRLPPTPRYEQQQ